MPNAKPTPQFEHRGSLITYKSAGQDACLGYLYHFEGHGVYDAYFGRVDVSPVDAETHNRCLQQAELEGLDQHCRIGQGGTFYYRSDANKVQTFTGELVSSDVTRRGASVTFRRRGKAFRGRLRQDGDAFHFRRVA
jgi:hypothetical protein